MTTTRLFSNLVRSTWSRTPASAALVLSLAALPAAAQQQAWIEMIGTNNMDGLYVSMPDGAGGVYVGGHTQGTFPGETNAGYADAWLARYDSVGTRLWVREFGTADNEYAFAVAADALGGVHVSGWTGGIGTGIYDVWVRRYDSAGTLAWTHQFGTSADDQVYAAAPDASGGGYVCGITRGDLGAPNAGLWDVWFARYDSAGNQLWIVQIGTSAEDRVYAAAPDASGGMYVSGRTDGSLGGTLAGPSDAWLARYDSAGNQVWIRQFGSIDYDGARAAAPDGTGGVFVGGWTYGSLAGPNMGLGDTFVARFDSNGNQLWARQHGTGAIDELLGATPDESGGVYVSGLTEGNLNGQNPNPGYADIWAGHYDRTGNRLWGHQLGTDFEEWSWTAASDGAGGVYVGGNAQFSLTQPAAVAFDGFLVHYDGSCGVESIYCAASTTSIPGCQASIGATGSMSFANPNTFTITSGSVPGGGVGLCFFGNGGPANTPLGTLGGKLCVQPPLVRTAPKPSGGSAGQCNGSYQFTLQDLIDASPIVTPGATIRAEIWARDSANPDGFLLSNAMRVTVCP